MTDPPPEHDWPDKRLPPGKTLRLLALIIGPILVVAVIAWELLHLAELLGH